MSVRDPLRQRDKMAGAEWDAEVVLKQEAVSGGGGASMQTGNTLEWRSVASFHKQHHRRVPDIYDLRSEWQHRPDPNPSLHVCSIVTRLNLPDRVSYFPRWKHQTFQMVVRTLGLKQVISVWEHWTWRRKWRVGESWERMLVTLSNQATVWSEGGKRSLIFIRLV